MMNGTARTSTMNFRIRLIGSASCSRHSKPRASSEPSPDRRCLRRQPLHEAVDPKQQQIDQREDRTVLQSIAAPESEPTADSRSARTRRSPRRWPRRPRGSRGTSAPTAPVPRRRARRAQKSDNEPGQKQARRQSNGDGQCKRRLNEAGNAIEQDSSGYRQSASSSDETADARGARVRTAMSRHCGARGRKCRSDKRPDGEDDDDRLGCQIEQPVERSGNGCAPADHDI